MQPTSIPTRILLLFFTALLFTYCSKSDDPENTADPANLAIEVLSIEQTTRKVQIQASAQHAELFQLYIGSDESPVAENQTGFFEYTFDEDGQYEIEIRAYGASGRYIKSTRQITISLETEPVPLDKGYFTPMEYDGYDLVWNDEFDGNEINSSNWVFETGDGCPNLCGWGNNEQQYYRTENAWVADDVLTIEAREETFGGRSYTSTRMKTQGRQSFQYGRIDIRALLPKGQGMWPALWMLGDNIPAVGWPQCGEIDIMELIGGGPGKDNRVHGTLHWEYDGHAQAGGDYTLATGDFADEYHVFTIIWDESSIRWFVNDVQYNVIDITPAHMSEFHQEFFFIFNIAVGGNWPGNPDNTTIFPQQMKVDYVRVFQHN
jgi:hypothetical protein